jgi:hypothetical protein
MIILHLFCGFLVKAARVPLLTSGQLSASCHNYDDVFRITRSDPENGSPQSLRGHRVVGFFICRETPANEKSAAIRVRFKATCLSEAVFF